MIYTSPIKIAGLPLVSIVLENKRFSEAKPAVGIIAIGQFAYGIISISQFGAGVICISQFGGGIVCLSQFGIGMIGLFQFGIACSSIAQFAINLFSGHGQFVLNLGKYFGEL